MPHVLKLCCGSLSADSLSADSLSAECNRDVPPHAMHEASVCTSH
jgi:hypothetical protein